MNLNIFRQGLRQTRTVNVPIIDKQYCRKFELLNTVNKYSENLSYLANSVS